MGACQMIDFLRPAAMGEGEVPSTRSGMLFHSSMKYMDLARFQKS
ncbi:MAG: hypothetical protein ACP5HH_07695 [Fervidicoccaceae archaeon]